MNKIVLLPILLLSSLFSASQTTDSIPNPLADTVYENVDTVATFPGGRKEWIKFVGNTLDANVGVENGAKEGNYKVNVRFTVTKDGSLKDFEPVTNFKHGFEEEVIRMMKLSPKWLPAIKNGVIVNSRVEQEQLFIITDEG